MIYCSLHFQVECPLNGPTINIKIVLDFIAQNKNINTIKPCSFDVIPLFLRVFFVNSQDQKVLHYAY